MGRKVWNLRPRELELTGELMLSRLLDYTMADAKFFICPYYIRDHNMLVILIKI